jgi:FecR protein
MRFAALLLLPITLLAGQSRYARIGDFEGTVEVQLQAADPWQPALRNMPVGELGWLRTGASSRLEIELDDGSVLRLGPDSLAELSDYTRLSTGQRISLLSLDHGLAYFTGAAEGKDAVILAVPGAQMTVHQPARLRLETREQYSQIAAGEGAARFSSPTAEFDLRPGQLIRLDPSHPARFSLFGEIPPLDTDRWSDERDKLLAATGSAGHVPGLHYGLADLDAHGVWIQSSDLGAVWKPKEPAIWAPFRNGKWRWYDGLGYTWISDDPWGWLPYHYGRWTQQPDTGWVWVPGKSRVFKPGEVYWLKSAKLVGWGPLAHGEDWKPPATPQLFLNANTTYAAYAAETREIDPAGFSTRPQEPLATAVFAPALPSPSFPAMRLDAVHPVLRAGSTRVVPVLDGVTFEGPAEPVEAQVTPPAPPPAAAYPAGPAPEQPVVIMSAPPAEQSPPDGYYAVPVYTGIIVVSPPGQKSQGAIGAGARPSTPPPPPHPHPKPADNDKPAH